MNELTPEAALAIIAGHGADPARWPDAARAALPALAARNADVAAALAAARDIDAALAGWLAAPVPAPAIDVGAITVQPQLAPEPSQHHTLAPRRSGWQPALAAASLALVVAVGGWLGLAGTPSARPDTPVVAAAPPPSAGAEAGEADLAFAYVFTPTAAEEDVI